MLRIGLSRSLKTGSLLRPVRANQFQLGTKIISASSPIVSPIRFNSSTTHVVEEITNKLVPISDTIADKVAATSLHANQIGYMDSIGLVDGWGPTALVTRLLEATYVYTGLPWWATIVAATVIVRVAMLPLYVRASTNATRMAKIKPQLEEIMSTMKQSKDNTETMKAMAKRKKLMKDNNVSTLATMAPILQAPIAYGFFRALHNFAAAPVEGFASEGYAWFPNLCEIDTYLGLQLISTGAIIALIRLGGETGQSAMSPQIKKIMTFVPILSILVTKDFTAGVLVYFAVNSILSFIQTMMLRAGFVRKLLGVPPKLSTQELTKSSGGDPEVGLMDSVSNYLEKHKEQAIATARKTDKQLEITQKRKQKAKEGYIKRH
ncbi:uncharacterized protein SPAPADRAFT_63552 [Spathaspora passalidarum NRRL Y-27907]|uniref:Membrane insertase YidC/Oxa/ALB C-terminal domain-containing protein n=1 Tax=Spathaspora passalidarum (strain NRRL Y-27907 / 11-Y1) TaxID=619300 RepID=G3AVH7_SPAPN|nr:uncharacterized protein SPAPADRAFT_63552 [Spathaspora passalidarum NRRL Y-27907]EGW29926.1 hypothetical protein SPAPADRAFT_63552 [Spathaspora passalidarum NRRL Y-27907]